VRLYNSPDRETPDGLVSCTARVQNLCAAQATELLLRSVVIIATQMPLSPGTRLGPYEVLSFIGAGGMGEVYRALDSTLKREVAIKILPSSIAADSERLRRFRNEAEAAAALNHPNILCLFHIGEHSGAPYLVSELLKGATLRDRLRAGPLSTRKALDLATQLARALAAAHDRGIVHRDLKPENIFITEQEQVKVLDFGLAKLTRRDPMADNSVETLETQAGTAMGTLAYMSPEQIRGQAADSRSDIFSFGVVLYEILAGKRAFQGQTSADTMSAILNQDPPDLAEGTRNIPPALERIVRHCMEKAPEARFQSAHDIAFALETLSTISGSPTVGFQQTTGRKFPSWLWLAGPGCLTLGLIAGLWLHSTHSQSSPLTYRHLTFRKGWVQNARFSADGQTIYYGAVLDSSVPQTYVVHPGSPESHVIENANTYLLSVSKAGELAVLLHPQVRPTVTGGTLARIATGGVGAPREVLNDVTAADWSADAKDLAVAHIVGGKGRVEFPVGRVLYEGQGWISNMRFSPDGQRLAFLDHVSSELDWSGMLVVCSLQDRCRELTKPDTSIFSLAWSANGKEVWFSSDVVESSPVIMAVDLAGKTREVLHGPGGLIVQDISSDGRVLLTREELRVEIVALDPFTKREHPLPWLNFENVDDISSDGKFILFEETPDAGIVSGSLWWRATDGSAPVRLADGTGTALSPDQRWALVWPDDRKPYAVPIGAGAPREFPDSGLPWTESAADWLPDQHHIVFVSNVTSQKEGRKRRRVFVQDIETGNTKPIAPEGFTFHWPTHPVSPDGKEIILTNDEGALFLWPLDGEVVGRPIAGTQPGDSPMRWSSDKKAIYVYRPLRSPFAIYRVDIGSGKRELWRELAPGVQPGQVAIVAAQITPDGKTYAYSYGLRQSELYLVQGLN
jgi:eukaryotic-like serine/threonine-protein kinase